jgi:hypothetical protein
VARPANALDGLRLHLNELEDKMSGTLFINDDSVWMPNSEDYNFIMQKISSHLMKDSPDLAYQLNINDVGDHISLKSFTTIEIEKIRDTIVHIMYNLMEKRGFGDRESCRIIFYLTELLALISIDSRLKNRFSVVKIENYGKGSVVLPDFVIWLFLSCCIMLSEDKRVYKEYLQECLTSPESFSKIITRIPGILYGNALDFLRARYREGHDINNSEFISIVRSGIEKLQGITF